MKRNHIRLLIVDDDATQGKALLEVFHRAGYQAVWCNSSAQALTTAGRQEFHGLLVDCLLPKINGVDLVSEIKRKSQQTAKVFMFSGVFKNRKFIKETLNRTGAVAYYTKPLDLAEVLEQVDEALADESTADDPPLLTLYSSEPLLAEELLTLMQTETTIHSAHLPILYKRLQQSDLCGELTLISGAGDLNTISFFNGQVFSVKTPDKDSYFGGLAVGYGFVSPEEVLEALKNPSTKRLGQKLIESLSLSPHAINVILEEQLALRLSQTVQSGVVSLQWTKRSFAKPEYTLNRDRFNTLLNDWTRSKITPEWIKANFALWGGYLLQGHAHPQIANLGTIDDLFSHPDFVDKEDLTYFFRQLLNGNASIGLRGGQAPNFNFLGGRLDQLLEEYKSQNHFQILGVNEKAQTLELNKAMEDLRKHFDPQALPPEAPPAIRVKCAKVFQYIETAHQTLVDDQSRHAYLLLLQNKRAQEVLENEPVFRAAVMELQNGQAKSAGKRFQTLLDKKIEFRDLRAYRIWAGLKADKRFSAMTLDQVPPEERHSAPYLMAKGVFHRHRGQIPKALEAFRTAHILDPRLSIARAELEDLRAELERKGHNRTLLKEVTTVIDNLFGKISRRGA